MAITIQILERDDVIQATDFVRYTEIEYTGQSDTVMTRNTYGGSPMNFFRWLRADQAGIPYWIGKTVGEFEAALNRLEKPHQMIARWEFARGPIPQSHQYLLQPQH